jgi:hypothetical protein
MHLISAIVIFYLLYLSWVTVFFALPSCNRFPESERIVKNVRLLKAFSVVHSYTVFAFALTLLIKAKSFGIHPECNSHAVVVLFRPFSALHAGRIVCWVLTVIVVVVYTLITMKDHLPSHLSLAYQRVRKMAVLKPVVKEKVPDPEPVVIERIDFAPELQYTTHTLPTSSSRQPPVEIDKQVSDKISRRKPSHTDTFLHRVNNIPTNSLLRGT